MRLGLFSSASFDVCDQNSAVVILGVVKKTIEHNITHQYQPTATTCSQTALSILMSCYGRNVTPQQIEAGVPQVRDDQGIEAGTINVQLATWCLRQGFAVNLHSFDCQILDQSWSGLSATALLDRMQSTASALPIPSLGPTGSKAYREAYIEFLRLGGQLTIDSHLTQQSIFELLQSSPFLAGVCFHVLYKGEGKKRQINQFEYVPDDVNGRAMNHSIVVYGYNAEGSLLVADSWQKPGLHVVEPERLVAAISAAQIECDNMIFTVSPTSSSSNP